MTKEELRQSQLKQLEALKYIDRICKENGLVYMANCGTALGAVRHHGYIPWDCDTDILMPEEDAIKLHKIIEKEKNKYYSVPKEVDHLEDLVDINDTIMYQDIPGKKKIILHNHIDISPYIESKKYPRCIGEILSIFNRMCAYIIAYRRCPDNYSFWKKLLLSSLSKIFSSYTSEDLRMLARKIVKSKRKSGFYSAYGGYYGFDKETYPKEWLDTQVLMPFEDFEIPVPSHYDEYLTALYGDWKTPPPEDERLPSYLDSLVYQEIKIES